MSIPTTKEASGPGSIPRVRFISLSVDMAARGGTRRVGEGEEMVVGLVNRRDLTRPTSLGTAIGESNSAPRLFCFPLCLSGWLAVASPCGVSSSSSSPSPRLFLLSGFFPKVTSAGRTHTHSRAGARSGAHWSHAWVAKKDARVEFEFRTFFEFSNFHRT